MLYMKVHVQFNIREKISTVSFGVQALLFCNSECILHTETVLLETTFSLTGHESEIIYSVIYVLHPRFIRHYFVNNVA